MMKSQAIEFATGAMAGCCACLFTNPCEVVKTRMQLQGELQARGSYTIFYRGILHAFYTIYRHEGVLALQRGLCPALLYQVIMNGSRLGSYQVVTNLGLTRGHDGKPVFLKCLIAGAAAGGLSAFIASPSSLLKTQFQAKSAHEIAVGHQHSHTSLTQALRVVYQESGIRGLWRGASGVVPRNAVGTAAQLSTFSITQDFLADSGIFSPRSWLVVTLSSMISSIAVVVCFTPFDVISTRLYNQGTSAKGRGLFYSGPVDCFVKIFKAEGIFGFYKGIGPQYLRTGPQTILCLMLWDKLKNMYRRVFDQQELGKQRQLMINGEFQ